MAHRKNKHIPCYKAQDLLDLHLWNDPSLTSKDRVAFQNHLQHCHKCLDEYEGSKWVLVLVKKYWKPEEDPTYAKDSSESVGQEMPEWFNVHSVGKSNYGPVHDMDVHANLLW